MPGVAGIVKVDPPPLTVLPFRYNPAQYLRQLGTANWEERQVDRGKAVVEYRGVSAHRITLDLFFDAIRKSPVGYARPGSAPLSAVDVEPQLEQLHRLALPWVQGDPTSEPPKLQVRYGHGQQIRWVIAGLIYNRELRSPTSGRRVQADVTVELLEYTSATPALSPVEAAQVVANAPYNRPVDEGAIPFNRPSPHYVRPGSQRLYTVRSGDTLSTIAARELGSAGRFMEVYNLNTPSPMNQGPDYLQVGWVLRLPAE